jgi:hypothetical protein
MKTKICRQDAKNARGTGLVGSNHESRITIHDSRAAAAMAAMGLERRP